MGTIRQQIIALLEEHEMSALELSQAVGVREKEVYDHLAHIVRTLRSGGKQLMRIPSECLACGYVFERRTRLTPPGRCPQCRKTHVSRPRFHVIDT